MERLIRLLHRIYYLVVAAKLRACGHSVSWKSKIHHSAELRSMRGEIRVGADTVIDKGAIIRAHGGQVSIGDNCSINPYCVLYGHGDLTVGNGVRIAAQTVIIPANHLFADPAVPIYRQGESKLGISIGDDVWIGTGARILDGVSVGAGCVIGAGAVVTKSTEPYCVYTGVPAIKVKKRTQAE